MSSTLSQVYAARPVTAAQMLAAMLLYIDDPTAAAGSKDKGAQLAELRKALSGYNASASSATGTTTVTPGVLAMRHTEVLTVTGEAGTRTIVLDTANSPAAGDQIDLRLNLPATGSILLDVRNATAAGTQITTFETDGSGSDAVLSFYFDGTAWQFLSATYPANA